MARAGLEPATPALSGWPGPFIPGAGGVFLTSDAVPLGSVGAVNAHWSRLAQDLRGGRLANCVLWDNSPDQISGTAPDVRYCDIQGGFPGTGNIAADPLFIDPDKGNYALSAESPCIDAADNAAVPEDIEADLDGNPRFLDVPETPDTGNGEPPVVDIGAYESLGGGCLALSSQEVDCHPDGSTFTLSIAGLSACTGGTVMAAFTASGGAVGEDLCFTIMVNQEQGGFCCSTQVCAPVPDCSEATADLDGDGVVGVLDLILLLAQSARTREAAGPIWTTTARSASRTCSSCWRTGTERGLDADGACWAAYAAINF